MGSKGGAMKGDITAHGTIDVTLMQERHRLRERSRASCVSEAWGMRCAVGQSIVC